jgi:hypothetical protein
MIKNLLFTTIILMSLVISGCSPAASPNRTIAAKTPLRTPKPSLSINLTPTFTHESTDQASIQPALTAEKPTIHATPSKSASFTRTNPTPKQTKAVGATKSPSRTAQPSSTLSPERWKELPVVPEISDDVLKIYLRGLELGNNPLAFSKIGDCGSTPSWFLGDFDRGSRYYRLGEYADLQNVIDYFQGSFDRTSLAARSGFNTSALFTPLWADRQFCLSNETPLACEYRVHKPAIAFVMLGANDVWQPGEFEPQMRKLIEYSIDKGVIPILSTKADNQEGDGSINATIAQLALEYQIPLWNFWRATNELPDQGLQEDGVHLTWGPNNFDQDHILDLAWPVRNLTALQVLDQLWNKVTRK